LYLPPPNTVCMFVSDVEIEIPMFKLKPKSEFRFQHRN
jgi:hypothetical protein